MLLGCESIEKLAKLMSRLGDSPGFYAALNTANRGYRPNGSEIHSLSAKITLVLRSKRRLWLNANFMTDTSLAFAAPQKVD